ncbi:hypothetical protein H4R35_000826 [Dimargaris xerosporica]|nr:hypothetical protein H4R35_000826 [Dimargaris xerosporica]
MKCIQSTPANPTMDDDHLVPISSSPKVPVTPGIGCSATKKTLGLVTGLQQQMQAVMENLVTLLRETNDFYRQVQDELDERLAMLDAREQRLQDKWAETKAGVRRLQHQTEQHLIPSSDDACHGG